MVFFTIFLYLLLLIYSASTFRWHGPFPGLARSVSFALIADFTVYLCIFHIFVYANNFSI